MSRIILSIILASMMALLPGGGTVRAQTAGQIEQEIEEVIEEQEKEEKTELTQEDLDSIGADESISLNYRVSMGDGWDVEDDEVPQLTTIKKNPARILGATLTGVETGQTSEIQMTIDKLAVDLGNLTPGIFGTGKNIISVRSTINAGYGLYAAEKMTMRRLQNNDRLLNFTVMEPHPREEVPDVTCDGGDCNFETAGVWESADVPGFGYTVISDDAITGTSAFGGGYKAFFNRDKYEKDQSAYAPSVDYPAQLIAYKAYADEIINNRQTEVTYKASVKADSEAGEYATFVYYTLIPNF